METYKTSYEGMNTEPIKYHESQKQLRKPFQNIEDPINRVLGYNKTDISDRLDPILSLEL
jgi:hypothetical protein